MCSSGDSFLSVWNPCKSLCVCLVTPCCDPCVCVCSTPGQPPKLMSSALVLPGSRTKSPQDDNISRVEAKDDSSLGRCARAVCVCVCVRAKMKAVSDCDCVFEVNSAAGPDLTSACSLPVVQSSLVGLSIPVVASPLHISVLISTLSLAANGRSARSHTNSVSWTSR